MIVEWTKLLAKPGLAIGFDGGGGNDVLSGGAGGRLQGGRHAVCAAGTPLTNLLLSILDKVDVHRDRIGDSTGRLTEV